MDGDRDRRVELGTFLRARREQLVRSDCGLPPVGRGPRTVGLRREEVAALSGVSVTWYTWLEQGRDIRPSRQVLDAIARTLRLTPAQHSYLLSLSGYAPQVPVDVPAVADAPAHVQRLMDALTGFPAYAIAGDWGIAGWNAAYEALYPNVARVGRHDRNLLWLVFTDPYVRTLLPDWVETSRRFLAEFRAEVGPRLGDEPLLQLVDRLSEASAEFRSGWASHDVGGFTSRERVFDHPIVGRLRLEHHQVIPADHPDLQIVIYTPVPGTGSVDQVRRLTAPPGDRMTAGTAAPTGVHG